MLDVPFIPDPRIDRLMEETVEDSNLWAAPPAVFDIETFIEKHLACKMDITDDLPDGVMGEFVFERGEPLRVKIDAGLTNEADNADEPWKEGRWRMTAAHEGAHVLLHLPLFLGQGTQSGLWNGAQTLVYRCYRGAGTGARERFSEADLADEENDVVARYGWNSGLLVNETPARQRMEIQANRGGAALLMPVSRFQKDARLVCAHINRKQPDWSRQWRMDYVVRKLAARYVVSQQAARIRFDQLELACHLDNLVLF